MIYESYPWKQDLKRRKKLIVSHNKAWLFSMNLKTPYTVIEKGIFYSAFIIRKLIDCKGKLSDEADSYVLKADTVKPLKHVDMLHRWPEDDSHDWKHEKNVTVSGRNVCNWLIHSYIFFLIHGEDERVIGFGVSSDHDRNKILYRISLNDWIEYMNFIITDNVVSAEMQYEEKIADYRITKKRG